ncbi:MAG: hypothetical protein HZA89_15815 [Verrucomicrobia bacterium]|nr:hypothetical protein [Verrucomicrobiota bacterium]
MKLAMFRLLLVPILYVFALLIGSVLFSYHGTLSIGAPEPLSWRDFISLDLFTFAPMAGVMYFIPGLIASIASAMLLTSRFVKWPDLILFVCALIGFAVFQGWFAVKHVPGNLQGDFFKMISVTASVAFGLVAFAIASIMPAKLVTTVEERASFTAQRRKAILFRALPALIILIAFVGYQYYSRSPYRSHHVAFKIDNTLKFRGLSGGLVRPAGQIKATEHQIWGRLSVDITLPDGRVIRGKSGRVTVWDTTDGVAEISLSYQPDSSGRDMFAYWTDGGTLDKWSVPGNKINVKRSTYSVELFNDPDGGYMLDVRFPASKRLYPHQ